MQRSHRSVRNRPVRCRGHPGASPRSARISLALPRECFYTPVGVLRARWGSLPRTLGRRAVSFDDLSWFSLARVSGESLEPCRDHEPRHAADRVTITVVGGRVTAVVPGPYGATVRLRGGASFHADHVVLAMGNSVGPRIVPLGGPVRDA